MARLHPNGPRPTQITAGRIGLYLFLIVAVLFFTLPLYTMVVTSLKTMDEIRLGQIFSLPSKLDVSAWITAWSGACMGTVCVGIAAASGTRWRSPFRPSRSPSSSAPSTAMLCRSGGRAGRACSSACFWRVA